MLTLLLLLLIFQIYLRPVRDASLPISCKSIRHREPDRISTQPHRTMWPVWLVRPFIWYAALRIWEIERWVIVRDSMRKFACYVFFSSSTIICYGERNKRSCCTLSCEANCSVSDITEKRKICYLLANFLEIVGHNWNHHGKLGHMAYGLFTAKRSNTQPIPIDSLSAAIFRWNL